MIPSEEQPAFRDYLTICLVSLAVMLYQITLTRVLSVVVWYHFAFLTISMVMLGLGAPGVWFALTRNPLRFLPGLLLASGIAVPASVILMVKFGTVMLAKHVSFIVLAVLPATLAMGGVVCLMLIKATGPSVSRMYGVDLLGAGVGAVLVIPLMSVVPTPILAAGCGFLPLICLVLHPGRLRAISLGMMAVLAGVLLHGEALHITHSKNYDEKSAWASPIFEDWSPTARITIFDENFRALRRNKAGFAWGRGSAYPVKKYQGKIRQLWLEQDGSAGTPITRFDGNYNEVGHLLYDVTTVGYQLRPPERVAIIGAGGGRDILSALISGASEIDAVELNGRTIWAVSDEFGEFSGDIYHARGVNAIENEGRSHLTHTQKRYDLIQISLIDSWAASAAGAFALAENNLYTVEAFELYGERLAADGLISTSRWMTEMPRLIVLAYSALQSMGIEDPDRHMMIVSADKVGTLLTSTRPFTSSDLQRLDQICEERGFNRVHPIAPGERAPNRFIADIVAKGLVPMAGMGLNIEPPTDDSPYFFHLTSPFRELKDASAIKQLTGLYFNLKSTEVLQQAMVGTVVLSLLLFLSPFIARVREAEQDESVSHLLRATTYFASIGFAFMLMENMLLQRFVLYLGHPSYATTVIIASLLIGMGVGSTFAMRFGLPRLQRFGLVVPLILILLVMALPPLFSGTLGQPFGVRIAVAFAILLPLGGILGLFFPLGMLHFGDRSKPWYWAINGVFGVVASVLSLALSMEFGFAVVGMLGAAGYLLAWGCLLGTAADSS